MAQKSKVCFDKRLLRLIRKGRNDEAKSMLTPELAMAYDEDVGSLLQYATKAENEVIVEELIKLGSDVDFSREHDHTPLMLALEYCENAKIVEVLLEANANINITYDEGISALHMVFDPDNFNSAITKAILRRLQNETSSLDELADKLIVYNDFSLCHAVCLGDVQIMDCLLKRGFDVDSQGPNGRTALVVAVELNDGDMVKWLVCNGANVDAKNRNNLGSTELIICVWSGNKYMLEILLELGANPNISGRFGYRALYTAVLSSKYKAKILEPVEPYDDCVELLLLYGATIDDDMIYHSLDGESRIQTNLLIAHVAMLEKLGTLDAKSVMLHNIPHDRAELLPQLNNYYEICKQLLGSTVYGKVSLFDLLTGSDTKMKIYARNKSLIQKSEDLCESCSYYAKILRKRVSKANHVIKLEDAAIPVLCKIFQANDNLCYDIARKIVSYLANNDLEQLCQV